MENTCQFETIRRRHELTTSEIIDSKSIDPELKPVLIELNEHGYTTDMSCAGHPSEVKGFKTHRGWISFHSVFVTLDVDEILEKHGLTGLAWECGNCGCKHIDVYHLTVSFNPIGKPKDYAENDLIPGKGIYIPTIEDRLREREEVEYYNQEEQYRYERGKY